MRIAQIAPLYESVPPKLYGAVERMISYLTEELVRRGHDVTLFASGDSQTSADLVASCPQALRGSGGWVDPIEFHALQLHQLFERSFDVVHFNIEYLSFPFSKLLGRPNVTTLHGPLRENAELFRAFDTLPFVAISDSQKTPFPALNWRRTIHHGLPIDQYAFNPGPGQYLAFLGRIAPEKRCDRAIAIAKQTGIPLKIAAKVDPFYAPYFQTKIKPLLDNSIEFIGEIGEREKNEFLGKALALLLPIDWPEPFGLVMIEALACGTPVIAYRRGSIPEIIEHGRTGYVVDDLNGAAEAVRNIGSIDRRQCRTAFETRFTASRMADEYVSVYEGLLDLWPEYRC